MCNSRGPKIEPRHPKTFSQCQNLCSYKKKKKKKEKQGDQREFCHFWRRWRWPTLFSNCRNKVGVRQKGALLQTASRVPSGQDFQLPAWGPAFKALGELFPTLFVGRISSEEEISVTQENSHRKKGDAVKPQAKFRPMAKSKTVLSRTLSKQTKIKTGLF